MLELPDTPAPARVAEGEFQLALVNLATNARHAQPDGGSFHLQLADSVTLERAHPPEVEEGEYWVVTCVDEGIGMSPEVRKQVFDPYFTTRGPASGTGLGLATVYGMMRGLEGAIEVESEPGQGARFWLWFPKAEAARSRAQARLVRDSGAEQVLLVEDEPTVRHLTTRLLREQGYIVTAMGDAEEALDLSDKALGEYAALFSDVQLPGMDGVALARALLLRHPGLKVLLTSGFVFDAAVARSMKDLPFLPKPYTRASLFGALRALLDA